MIIVPNCTYLVPVMQGFGHKMSMAISLKEKLDKTQYPSITKTDLVTGSFVRKTIYFVSVTADQVLTMQCLTWLN